MSRAWKEQGETSQWRYHVHVCSFTFTFQSLTEIEEYRQFFSQPMKPSFRSAGVDPRTDIRRGDHYDCQTAFARLPLYLWEKPKKQKVVKALSKALSEFANS